SAPQSCQYALNAQYTDSSAQLQAFTLSRKQDRDALYDLIEIDTEADANFLVGFDYVAQVLAETVLVHFLARGFIPDAAAVRTELVTEQKLALVHAKFELVIDEQHAGLQKQILQHRINPER